MSVEEQLEKQRRQPDASSDAALWRRFAGAFGDDVRASSMQRLQLNGPVPDGINDALREIVSPDRQRGEALMADVWRIGNEKLEMAAGIAPWSVPAPSRHYADRLHRFGWLPDLFSQAERGANRAGDLVDSWIEEFGRFNPFAWRLGPTADRAWNWLIYGRRLFQKAPQNRRRLECLARQLRHIEMSIPTSPDPNARWRGACVLLAQSIALHDGQGLELHIARLENEFTAQILPDGGHVSRSPERLLWALADVLILVGAFEQTGRPTPEFLKKGVPRMGAMLAFFRSQDGRLMPFQDGGEAREDAVSDVLNALPSEPRKFSFAMKSGYQKLERGDLRLVLDCGAAPDQPFAGLAHAGPLGFELHDGRERLVTSCGFSRELNLDWQAAVRRTGAHSTLALAARDAASFKTFEESRLLTPRGPDGISAKRLEEADEIWLDAQHGGWKSTFGVLHRRRLFMAADGRRLAGEDAIVRPVSVGVSEERGMVNFDIRFHLHPAVTAFTSGDAIRLTCANGQVWRFRTTHPGTRIEPSIYIARGRTERTEQIVLSGRADLNGDGAEPPNCVRWAFLKETAA